MLGGPRRLLRTRVPEPLSCTQMGGSWGAREPCHFLLVVLHLVTRVFPLRCSLSRKSFQRLSEVWDEDGNFSVPSAQGHRQCRHPSDQVPGRPAWPWLCTWSFLETAPPISVHLTCLPPCGHADTLGPCSLNPPRPPEPRLHHGRPLGQEWAPFAALFSGFFCSLRCQLNPA